MDFVSWQKFGVFAAAIVFGGFLLWKYRPRFPLPRLPRATRDAPKQRTDSIDREIAEARERARHAKTPRDRAEALVLAAEAAAKADEDLTSAMGLYLRAMRADATFCDPIRGIAALLRKERPELLETVLWRRLAHVPWSGDTLPAVKCAADALVGLYRRELRQRDRAHALQKMIAYISR
jgi:hypothetical protein